MSEKFDIKDIIAIGRTMDEYARMFDLTFAGMKNTRILDAGGGVSSFTAEASALGLSVISADRVYSLTQDVLEKKCRADLEEMFLTLAPVRGSYIWDFYGDEGGLRRHREAAYKKFLGDYGTGRRTRYINTNFPVSAFTNGEFDLTLMSHLLFLYDEHLDYNFHADTLAELARITSGEIRIFPVVNLRYARSPFVYRMINDVRFSRLKFQLKKQDMNS